MATIKTHTEPPVKLRKMMLSDMDSLMKLKDVEGWNQLEKDWALLISYKESVNLVAVLDDRIVGTTTAINYDNTVAWIGMMLVDRNYRGRGIARLLLLETIDKLHRCKSIKLDATPAGRPVYLKLGFRDEYTLYRMTNPSVSQVSLNDFPFNTKQIKPADIPEVAAFDKKVFGADRTELIRCLYDSYPELGWLIKEDNHIAGFCLGRRGQNFTQIGPVSAFSSNGVKALIQSAMDQLTGQAVVADICAAKSEILGWLEACGFISQRPFERMYLAGNPHPGIIENQYLISGPELG
ncbi:MAG: GNAT family N-acetyltransferase [Bacteroidota bacterium]|nr:GNAT family N-acetyltransferase [Bacteroidota bacterium]